MFSSRTTVLATLVLFFVGQVAALPFYTPIQRVRDVEPFEVIAAYVKRDILDRQIPAEVATTAPDGVVRPYKRQIPAEVATTAPDGVVRPYKRQIPAEVATTAPDGVVRPYKRQIPAEVATMAPNGVVVPYSRDVDSEELD